MNWTEKKNSSIQALNTTECEIELLNLDANKSYAVTVVARSAFGTSLPSILLVLNTTNQGI